MKNLTCLLLLIINSIYLFANNNSNNTHIKTDTIQFVLTDHNNIAVQAILNRTDTVSLMFHTAVGSVSLTPQMCEKLSTNKEQKQSSTKSWTGSADVNYIENNQISIIDLEWKDLTIWLDMLSGPGTDGKFGPNFFEHKIIEINYDLNVLVLHEPSSFIPDSNIKSYDLYIDEYDSLFALGTIKSGNILVHHKFLIHSGYGGTVILDDAFKKANDVFDSLPILEEKDLKDSFGNIIKTKKVLVDQFKIFGFEFESMPLSYFDSELEIQKTSVLGGAMLKRFNIFLDIDEAKIHIGENRYTDTDFKNS